ncbi:molybdenum cofactor guanylyltransferase [Alicyclobacillus sp. ALC3]|uniref:molybdenum cofactor guanylyltransferase n=1 Tax=Alicyclobacillus sp. ALC3 TaxID=2796143 RepID=UPI00237986DF|nr:NTP transferase domain-containing protein [Alicyclobacillus sp. ALC3]WDL95467.1 NTP transferase domain-containing protein [Alicyclobacillus sp. ALC3]
MSSAALIVAGGASRRMGRNKLTLPWSRGSASTVLDAVLVATGVVVDRVVVLLPPEPGADVLRVVAQLPRVTAVTDALWRAGPLQAIAHGWPDVADCNEVFVTAGDLPGLQPGALLACQAALAAAGPNCDGATVVREGRLQPLLACYRQRAGQAFMEVADSGEARLQPALERLQLARVDAQSAGWPEWWTRPVHTPDDYEAWLRYVETSLDKREACVDEGT